MTYKYLKQFILIACSAWSLTVDATEISTLHQLKQELPQLLSELAEVDGSFVDVEPFLDGGKSLINDIYLIRTETKDLVIKVTSDRWEGKKTVNEVALLKFLKTHSTIPVPKVYAYCADKELSPIHKEYIILEKIEGIPLSLAYPSLANDRALYESVLSQLADILSQLRLFHFDAIGNFLPTEGEVASLTLRSIIDFPDSDPEQPYDSFNAYTKGCISYYISEMEENRLKFEPYASSLEKICASMDLSQTEEDPYFVLSHQDFVMKNILIKDGKITAVLDWEWAASAPREMEALSGLDFLVSPEDRQFFTERLHQNGIHDCFLPLSNQRTKAYELIGGAYSLVAHPEWFHGKLLHTARFLKQKLYQRKIRANPSISLSDVEKEIQSNLKLLTDYW